MHVGHAPSRHGDQLGLALHLLLARGHRLAVTRLHHGGLARGPCHGHLHAPRHPLGGQHDVAWQQLRLARGHLELAVAGDHVLGLLRWLARHELALGPRPAADHVLLARFLLWQLGGEDHLLAGLARLARLQELGRGLQDQLALGVVGDLLEGGVLAGAGAEVGLDHLELGLTHLLLHYHLLLLLLLLPGAGEDGDEPPDDIPLHSPCLAVHQALPDSRLVPPEVRLHPRPH